jgi:hypothetical protein
MDTIPFTGEVMYFDEMIDHVKMLMPIHDFIQAEHCGAGYFYFYGEDNAKKVCQAAFGFKHVTRPTAHISVHLDNNNELYYRVSISPCSFKDFTECLELAFQ